MPPSASCFCLAVAPERGGLRSHPQNGATRTATANPATDRGIAAGRSALPSRNTTGNLPKTRLFRRFVEGTSPSRLIAQLGVGQTVSCPDGPSPGDPNRGRKGLRFLAVYSFRRYWIAAKGVCHASSPDGSILYCTTTVIVVLWFKLPETAVTVAVYVPARVPGVVVVCEEDD